MMSSVGSNLHTNRLLLLPVQDSDIEYIHRGLSDPKVIKHYGVSYETLEDTKEQMDWYRQLRENETGFWWKIQIKQSKEFIGAIGLNDIQPEHRRGEIGFWLLPKFWGQGFISEALPVVLKYGFNDLCLHRIEAWIEAGNTASSKVVEKFGFQKEGTLRDHEIKNGAHISVNVFAKLVGSVS